MASPAELIESYLAGPRELRRAVAGLSPEHLRTRPVAGKWSTLEVVAHLADSEQAWCHRMKRALAEERPLLIGYDETRFTEALGYHDRDPEEDLGLIEAMRRQFARLLRALPESSYRRVGVHSERGLLTLEEMLVAEIEHIPHHVRHILDKRRALGLPELT